MGLLRGLSTFSVGICGAVWLGLRRLSLDIVWKLPSLKGILGSRRCIMPKVSMRSLSPIRTRSRTNNSTSMPHSNLSNNSLSPLTNKQKNKHQDKQQDKQKNKLKRYKLKEKYIR